MTNETKPLLCTKCNKVADGCVWSAVRVDLCSECHPNLPEMECGGHKINFGVINDTPVLVCILHKFTKKGILSYPDFSVIDNTINNLNKVFDSLMSNKSEIDGLVRNFRHKRNTTRDNLIILGDEVNQGILKYLLKEERAHFAKMCKDLPNLASRRTLYGRIFMLENAGILVSDLVESNVGSEHVHYHVKEYHISRKHIHWVRDALQMHDVDI